MKEITDAQMHILQHSLGVDKYGRGEQYRNHFVTGEGSKDHAACLRLVELGLMLRRTGNAITGGDDLFWVSAYGVDYVAINSPSPPPEKKLTRSQRRYRKFLNADTGCSFAEWIGAKS